MMTYKGYTGKVEFDDEARIFHGEIVGLKDLITFQGKTVDELEQAFRDSIDDYLNWFNERGETPEKVFSGVSPRSLNLRISPELHAQLVKSAAIK